MKGTSATVRYSLVFALGLTAAMSACQPEPSPATTTPPATRSSALLDAQNSTDDQDYAVYINGYGNSATGVLVAPNLVVTALHVVSDSENIGDQEGKTIGKLCQTGSPHETVFGAKDPIHFRIFAGKEKPTASTPRQSRGSEIRTLKYLDLCDGDLAFIYIDPPLVDTPIAPIRLDSLPIAGEEYFDVGWGSMDSDNNQADARRVRTGMMVQAVGPGQFQPPGTIIAYDLSKSMLFGTTGPCFGDSGSGAFSAKTKAVFGIFSSGEPVDPSFVYDPKNPAKLCLNSTTSYSFFYPFRDQIIEFFRHAGHAPWLEGKAPPAALGASCAEDLDCDSMLCVKGSCASSCDTTACPDGYECTTQTQGKVCTKVSATPSGLSQGSACVKPSDCTSGLCYQREEGNICSALCDQAPCADGWQCTDVSGVKACLPPPEGSRADLSGGCAMSAGSSGPTPLGLLVALGLLARRRGKRRAGE